MAKEDMIMMEYEKKWSRRVRRKLRRMEKRMNDNDGDEINIERA